MTRDSPAFLDPKSPWVSFWPLQLAGWFVYFIVVYVTFLTIAPPSNFLFLLLFKAYRAFCGFVLSSLFLRPIYRRVSRSVSVPGAITVVLACSTALGVVWTALEFAYIQFVTVAPSVPGYLARSPRLVLDYAMTLAAWSALYLGAKFWSGWRHEREKALEAEALTKAAQLEMLRYQINPHFLFNALNSLRALVDEDAAKAKTTITQLSEFLRYSLLNEPRAMVALSEELEAVANYLEIEKTRFEEKLDVAFDIESAARGRMVPSFVLNPLIENAVKHGFRSSPKPLRIRVAAKINDAGMLVIEVMNSGALGPHAAAAGTGIGLNNVRRRLESLFGARGGFSLTEDQGWVRARIEMPS